MNKTDYMNTLRRELEGLPAELIEDTLWTYEGKFVDGLVAGQTEEEIAAKLPTPQLVAAQKRANLRLTTLKNDFSPSNLLSLLVAGLGVLVFNLLMVFPAVVYTAMLFSAYATSLAFYIAGIIMTAASLSGVPQMTIELPYKHHHMSFERHDRSYNGDVVVDISGNGIHVTHDKGETTITSEKEAKDESASTTAQSTETKPEKRSLRIGNRLNEVSAFKGFGLLLGGILLFLFSLFMTKVTFVGFKHYLRWNISLLRLPQTA